MKHRLKVRKMYTDQNKLVFICRECGMFYYINREQYNRFGIWEWGPPSTEALICTAFYRPREF